ECDEDEGSENGSNLVIKKSWTILMNSKLGLVVNIVSGNGGPSVIFRRCLAGTALMRRTSFLRERRRCCRGWKIM
ncbi:hypothetical protein A2U01_0076739, partial [Trifolium medium]|nr:hypothetical protein [Trifolium medium]